METKDVITMVKKELRACYLPDGIAAGKHHFTDYWARDGYFAAFGSLAINDTNIVKKMVELFFKFQRADGLIPYRVMRGPVSLKKYLGKPGFYKNLRPTYKLRGFGNEVLDGTTLTVLFTSLLGIRKITSFVEYAPKIKKALDYLRSREKHELLNDGFMAEWNDTALKYGNLLYSNVIYWYMYDRLFFWAKKYDRGWSEQLIAKKEAIKKALYERLWNGKYFADWNDYKRQDYFYPFGNCLAVAWGITTQKETGSILKECRKVKISFTLESNSPKYPFWRIDPFQRLVGMGDYQNKSILWWQPVISYLQALKKVNDKKEEDTTRKNIIGKILRDGSVYECYERTGKPVRRLLYRSEHPFAWASGMIIGALKN